jgi:hypothetical protein
MKPQEIFDKVVEHLAKQGRHSLSRNKLHCLYRGPDGLMCAVGCLIPDEMYDPTIESQTISDIILAPSSLRTHLPSYFNGNIILLGDLQIAHDRSKDLESLLTLLIDISIRHKLNFDPSIIKNWNDHLEQS